MKRRRNFKNNFFVREGTVRFRFENYYGTISTVRTHVVRLVKFYSSIYKRLGEIFKTEKIRKDDTDVAKITDYMAAPVVRFTFVIRHAGKCSRSVSHENGLARCQPRDFII